MQELIGLVVFIVLASVLGVGLILIESFWNKHQHIQDDKTKPIVLLDKFIKFDSRFFAYPVFFLLFSIVGILFAAIGIVCAKISYKSVFLIGIFSFIVAFAMFYAIRKNLLKWR